MEDTNIYTYTIISHLREILIRDGLDYAHADRIAEDVNARLESHDTVSSLNGTTFSATFRPISDNGRNIGSYRRTVGAWIQS